MTNKKWAIVLIVLMSLLTITGCNQQSGESESKGTISIGKNNWAENIAVSNMWKILLEEQGYEVNLVSADKAIVYVGVADGDLDIGMEVWLPHTDAPFVEEYGDRFTIQDTWYENTGLGLVVPTYMDIESITELNEYADELGGRIIGIEPGASLMSLTEQVIEDYDLNFDLIESSDAAMSAELIRAYNNEEPIVVTLWSPHYIFANLDLKYLEDPQGVYGEDENIVFITREGFEDDYPEVLHWMNTWFMEDDSLGALMGIIDELGDPVEGAKMWIEDNRDLVDQWIN